MLVLDFPTLSVKEPASWDRMSKVTRRRLHGTYYAWWLAESLIAERRSILDFVIVTYIHSKFSKIRIPKQLIGNVNFDASIEGRMYSSLTRYFATQEILLARGKSLVESIKVHAPWNPGWENSLRVIDELCVAYNDAHHKACPYRIELRELTEEEDSPDPSDDDA